MYTEGLRGQAHRDSRPQGGGRQDQGYGVRSIMDGGGSSLILRG